MGCSSMRSTILIILLRDMLGYVISSLTLPFIILIYVFSGLSTSIVSVLNIEFYFGIVHPLFHSTNVNKSRVFKAIVFFLFIIVIVGFIVLPDAKIVNFVRGMTLILNLAILIVIYVKIFLTGGKTLPNNLSASGNTQQKAFLRKKKLAKSCLLVVGCFYACFLPRAVVPFLSNSPFVTNVLWTWITNLLFANSTLNSVIFFWRNKILRNEGKLIVSQFFKRPQ